MNAISVSRCSLTEKDAIVVYDVQEYIRSWSRRGIFWGSLFGFVLGAIFVVNPFTADTLTFGIFGTLIICAIECAVIAGGFGMLTAALSGHGVLRGNTTRLERTLATGRQPASANRHDISLSAWSARWPFRVHPPIRTHSAGR